MDLQKALDLLEITPEDSLNPECVKKKYHQQALRWHPDKNKDPRAHEKFQSIHDAYCFLLQNENKEPKQDFPSILTQFMRTLFQNDLLLTIIQEILTEIQPNGITFHYLKGKCEKLDKQKIIELYQCLWKYKHIFHIREDILSLVSLVIQEKYQNDHIVVLEPTLEDILEHKIYKLMINEELYLVPLWHQELYFDGPEENTEVIVLCQPQLPEDITMDENNTIYVEKYVNIREEWMNPFVSLNVGGKNFLIPTDKLFLKKEQLFRLKGQGVARIDKDMYNISNKSDVVVKIIFC
jgi:hypothetical protein